MVVDVTVPCCHLHSEAGDSVLIGQDVRFWESDINSWTVRLLSIMIREVLASFLM